MVSVDHLRERITECLREARRTLDIGEQEPDLFGRLREKLGAFLNVRRDRVKTSTIINGELAFEVSFQNCNRCHLSGGPGAKDN